MDPSNTQPDTDTPTQTTSTPTSTAKPRPTARPRASVTRRSKAEREEYARLEAARLQEREKASSRRSDAAPRGRGDSTRGARGRGGANTNRISGGAVFGGEGVRARAKVDTGVGEAVDGSFIGAGAASGSGPAGGSTGISTSSAGAVKSERTKSTKDETQVFTVDSDDEQPKRDIERIWISSDEEDEDALPAKKGKQAVRNTLPPDQRPKPLGLRPVRAARTLATEDPNADLTKRGRAAPKKGGPGDAMEVSSDEMQDPGWVKKASTSPELSRKTLTKTRSREAREVQTETVEERAERLRLEDDLSKMRTAFAPTSKRDTTDMENGLGLATSDEPRLFLFQFPPLIPLLHDPSVEEMVDVEPTDLPIKKEPGTAAGATKPDAKTTTFTAASPLTSRPPPGLIGKMNVHRSGRVTLDWGGAAMEVRHGTDVDFLQDVVLLETPTTTAAEDGEEAMPPKTGKAYLLGHVKSKMVCVPDWAKLYA